MGELIIFVLIVIVPCFFIFKVIKQQNDLPKGWYCGNCGKLTPNGTYCQHCEGTTKD